MQSALNPLLPSLAGLVCPSLTCTASKKAAPLSPLLATLTKTRYFSSKTTPVSPFAATLTKNTGVGVRLRAFPSNDPPRVFIASLFRYLVTSLFRTSNPVGDAALHALEEEQPAQEDGENHGSRGEQKRSRGLAVAGKSPAETVNHSGHRIQAI